MAPRLDLQKLLVELLGSDNVYFQPPPSVQMNYPAIVYKLDDEKTELLVTSRISVHAVDVDHNRS